MARRGRGGKKAVAWYRWRAQGQSQKRKNVRDYLNLPQEAAPEYSYLADYLVAAYVQIARARRYEQGVPLPLSLRDVADFADCADVPVSRALINRAVFAIDDAAMAGG